MRFLRKHGGRACLLLLALLVLCVPALAEEADRGDYYSLDPAAPPPMAAALTQLDAPADLTWGMDLAWDSEQEGYRPAASPGSFIWRLGGVRLGTYRVRIYRWTESGDVLVDSLEPWYESGTELEDGSLWGSCGSFRHLEAVSGDYFFTVQALGDGMEYGDSPVVRSRVWHYEKPGDALRAPDRPVHSEGRTFLWTVPQDARTCADRLVCEFFYAPERDAEPVAVTALNWHYDAESPSEESAWLSDRIMGQNGAGWYSVRVRTISRDVTAVCSSPWSELSEPVYFKTGAESLEELAGSVTPESSEQEKRTALEAARALYQESSDGMLDLLMKDRDGSGAAGCVRRLEASLGNETRIALAGGLEDVFDGSRISVVGAGLNAEPGEAAVLTFCPSEAEIALPEEYVPGPGFYLRLENEEGADLTDYGWLDFPLRVAVPLPGGMDPKAAVLFWGQAVNGETYSGEMPDYSIWKNEEGQWLAVFTAGGADSGSITILAERRLVTAQVSGGTEVSLNLEGLEGDYFCAVYDISGRMLEVRRASSGTLRFETPGAAEGKVFRLDGESRPSGEVWSFSIEKR